MTQASESPGKATVLVVTRNLPPLVGGMERLNAHVATELTQAYTVYVAGPSGATAHLPGAERVFEAKLSPLPVFLILNFLQAVWIALRYRPKIIIAGSGLCGPTVVIAAFLSRAKAVAYIHGLDIVVDHVVYRKLWLPFLRRLSGVIVNSQNTRKLALERGIGTRNLAVIHPGVSLHREIPNAEGFLEQFNLTNQPFLLSLGRITRRKGLAEFVAQVLPALVKKSPELKLVIIGSEAANALAGSRGSEIARVKAAAEAHGVAANILWLGFQDDLTVAQALSACRAMIFPVIELQGDVEGFGMVAVEAASAGAYTVAFDCGGIGDAVREGVSGTLIPAGDYAAMTHVLVALLEAPASKALLNDRKAFAETFSWTNFGRRLRNYLATL